MKKLYGGVLASLLSAWAINCQALSFPLPPKGSDVIGQVQNIRLQSGETLTDVVRQNDIGYYELIEANPQLNPSHLMNGTPIIIPTRYVLPNAPREGIIINLAELRIYYYPKDSNQVFTYPIGIGRQGWDTPTGQYKIVEKIENPEWHVPKSIAEDNFKRYGIVLPEIMPAGPDNPLGNYAMRLNIPSYLIHGTVEPASVGRRVSAGCIRMLPEDVESLFQIVPQGTKVTIVNQPYKIGWDGDNLVMESHKPLSEMRKEYAENIQSLWIQAIDSFIASQKAQTTLNWDLIDSVAKAQTGIPVDIGQKNA